MRELLLLIMLLTISAQSRTLLRSLIIVPRSLIIVMILNSTNSYSGLFILLYVIVFIGGLIVLLVRMASISLQDQIVWPDQVWIILILLFTPFTSIKYEMIIESLSTGTFWIIYTGINIFMLRLLLIIGIMVITLLLITFKSIVRGL